MPKKGSYLYYGQPAFEDNSFYLEEAFNQPKGVTQYISNFTFDKFISGNLLYSFTHEIPLTNLTHQLSYTLYYRVINENKGNASVTGLGDFYISYRPLLFGEKDWAMIIPRFTLILPTGSAKDGTGSGGWGGQFNLAVTKRLSRNIVTHYNLGFTLISDAKKYEFNASGSKVFLFKKDLYHQNLGASIIWYSTRKFNLLIEYVSNFICRIEKDGTLSNSHQLMLNPGFRFCIDTGHMQIVPGIGAPINFSDGNYDQTGVFLYLSFELDYLSFYKAKGK